MDATRPAPHGGDAYRREARGGRRAVDPTCAGASDGSVTAIYNRYGYVREMRLVFEQWATDLTADGSKITVLPREPFAAARIPESTASRSEEAA